MGLNIYCKDIDKDVSFPYSYFMRIREAISDAIGLPIYFMEYFLETRDVQLQTIQNINSIHEIYRVGLPISWDIVKSDELHKLICHSDCDGKLSWRAVGKIAKRLKEIKELIKFDKFGIHEKIYDELIELFIEANKIKKDIFFG